ncbi:MAG: ABC transporter permease, partial [Pyrinomonadaceae bacterium]
MLRMILLDRVLHEIRFGLRILWKNTGFTAVVVVTLALGIGATSAVFSVINAVLLRPMPHYQEPDRLVQIWTTLKNKSQSRFRLRVDDYTEIKKLDPTFTQVAICKSGSMNFTGSGEPENLSENLVSPNIFSLIGVKPMLGRTFSLDEDEPSKNQVVILSHSLWQRRFASADDVLGQTIRLEDKVFTIVGVMPADFTFLEPKTEFWLPLSITQENRKDGDKLAIARLNSGVTIGDAQRELNHLSQLLEQQGLSRDRRFVVISLRDQVAGDIRPALLLLFGAAGFVLLIACTNIASLYLAHGASRNKEIAIRAALGAGRAALIRQMLIESTLASLLGGGLGLLLAWWGISLVRSFHVATLPELKEIEIDRVVILFTLCSS